jgi:transposase
MARTEAVTTFQVNLASIKRWLARRRATGPCAAQPATGGAPRTILPAQEAALRARVAAVPDAPLAAHATRRHTHHGATLSARSLGRAIQRLGITRNKRR